MTQKQGCGVMGLLSLLIVLVIINIIVTRQATPGPAEKFGRTVDAIMGQEPKRLEGASAGRTCKANLAAICSSLSAHALRHNAYPDVISAIVGAPEGLAEMPPCPLGGEYQYSLVSGGANVNCPNARRHSEDGGGPADEWRKMLGSPASP
jgi:hypothetical protein